LARHHVEDGELVAALIRMAEAVALHPFNEPQGAGDSYFCPPSSRSLVPFLVTRRLRDLVWIFQVVLARCNTLLWLVHLHESRRLFFKRRCRGHVQPALHVGGPSSTTTYPFFPKAAWFGHARHL
jgi:hypothetical protein